MINNVTLTGRLTRDVDLKYTQSGTAVGSFSVAVERRFKNAQGERETDFINCVIWRKAAENFVRFTRKGSLVGVEGSIQTRNYENNQGQRVYVTEVLVENFTLLESKKDSQNNQNTSQGGFQNANDGNYTQSNQNSSQGNLNANANGGSINVMDDDLPF